MTTTPEPARYSPATELKAAELAAEEAAQRAVNALADGDRAGAAAWLSVAQLEIGTANTLGILIAAGEGREG